MSEAPAPAKKTIDFEVRLVKDVVRKTVQDRQKAIGDLINAIREYRKCGVQSTLVQFKTRRLIEPTGFRHSIHSQSKAIMTASLPLSIP